MSSCVREGVSEREKVRGKEESMRERTSERGVSERERRYEGERVSPRERKSE